MSGISMTVVMHPQRRRALRWQILPNVFFPLINMDVRITSPANDHFPGILLHETS